jgi:hypothetical protein
MSIVDQARAELERVDFGEGDSAVMLGLLRTFFGQWDSGGGVSVASEVLARLIAGQPLTPLTGEPDEWHDPMGDGQLLQNKRCSTVFRGRHGLCWDDGQPGAEKVPIEFPYNPVTRRVETPIYEVGGALEQVASDALAGGIGISRIDPLDYFEPIGDAAARVVEALTIGGESRHADDLGGLVGRGKEKP